MRRISLPPLNAVLAGFPTVRPSTTIIDGACTKPSRFLPSPIRAHMTFNRVSCSESLDDCRGGLRAEQPTALLSRGPSRRRGYAVSGPSTRLSPLSPLMAHPEFAALRPYPRFSSLCVFRLATLDGSRAFHCTFSFAHPPSYDRVSTNIGMSRAAIPSPMTLRPFAES